MKLTKNEKQVLTLLLDDGRISDVDMAVRMKISTQAVGKLRKKLEGSGVIEGYSCRLNYEKLGLRHFVVTHTTIHNPFWQQHGETASLDILRQNAPAIFSCMPSGTDTSLISLHAFRDIKELDLYLHLLKVRHPHLEVTASYSFSSLNMLKNSPTELLKSVLREEPIVP